MHALLLLLTIGTTTIAGALHYASFVSEFSARPVLFNGALLLHGFWYSGTLLAILGAHEMGHYLFCRRYDVDATLPYFIPMPPLVFLTGTLGAVIRIREAFPTRTSAVRHRRRRPDCRFPGARPGAVLRDDDLEHRAGADPRGTVLFLGEPLLFKWATHAVFGTVPQTVSR